MQVNQAANGVISSCDVLADFLESIERFVKRLQIYTPIPPTPAMGDVLINLIVELTLTLALVTQKLKQRRLRELLLADSLPYSAQRDAVKLVKIFFAVKDIKAAQERLERFVQGESRNTAAQILERVHGLERKLAGGG
jgi:hypothetical protein